METLPCEVIYQIISYLSIRSTMRFLRTCKYFNDLYHNDELLQKEIKRKFLTEPELMTLYEALNSDDPIKNLQVMQLKESDFNKFHLSNLNYVRPKYTKEKTEERRECIIS